MVLTRARVRAYYEKTLFIRGKARILTRIQLLEAKVWVIKLPNQLFSVPLQVNVQGAACQNGADTI
jgi:hypothetical protein